jgi:hypothetical protein
LAQPFWGCLDVGRSLLLAIALRLSPPLPDGAEHGHFAAARSRSQRATYPERFRGLARRILEQGPRLRRTRQFRLPIDVNATDRDQDAELERLLGSAGRGRYPA